ncbi:MAG: endo-1,3-1,4-beta-glycanase ExoK [Polaribacter sp.]|jgi:endo-1,3-1,4-beta-glycanase ExoK
MKSTVLLCSIFSIALLSCSTMGSPKTLIDEPLIAYPEYTGEYAGFHLVLDDRFNHFNDALWDKGDGGVGGETLCRFQDQGVQVVDGVLELVVRKQHVLPSWSADHQQQKGDYGFSCGEVRTVPDKKIRYGRIEARMKAPAREKSSGYISSLFTYTNDFKRNEPKAGSQEWEEIDIELEGHRPDKFQANLIYGKNTWEWWRTRVYGAWEDKIAVAPVDQWRVFAIEWVPDAIRWYVDGKLVKILTLEDIDCKPECVSPQEILTPIPDNLTSIIMNFWIPNDIIQDEFGGNKRNNVYPMKTQYDWLRYYQLDSHPLKTW